MTVYEYDSNSPAHHAVLLCLHGTHIAYHLGRCTELLSDELLVEKSDGYWIHELT